jgi:hypothetical protein
MITQYGCKCCGTTFFLKSNFDKHRLTVTAPLLKQTGRAKQKAYEASRANHRLVYPVIALTGTGIRSFDIPVRR